MVTQGKVYPKHMNLRIGSEFQSLGLVVGHTYQALVDTEICLVNSVNKRDTSMLPGNRTAKRFGVPNFLD